MKVTIRYFGRTMELFGLPPDQKEETIILREEDSYEDLLKKIHEKFWKANKDKTRKMEEYDIFNDIVVFSKGRILRNIKDTPIDHMEVIVAPLIAGG